jgi:hypothetical protein
MRSKYNIFPVFLAAAAVWQADARPRAWAGEKGDEPLSAEVAKRAVAVVNGEEISRERFLASRVVQGILQTPMEKQQRENLLFEQRQMMIRDLLVLQYVERNKLVCPDEVLEKLWAAHRRDEFQRMLKRPPKDGEDLPAEFLKAWGVKDEAEARQKFFSVRRPQAAIELAAMGQVDEKKVRKFYEENQPRMVSVIYLAPEDIEVAPAMRAEAVLQKRAEKMEALRKDIVDKKTTFDAAAQTVGTDPALKANRGAVGILFKTRPQPGYETVHASLFKLAEGEVSPVMRVDRSLLLATVTKAFTFEEAKPFIVQMFIVEQRDKMLLPFVEQARVQLAPLAVEDDKKQLPAAGE